MTSFEEIETTGEWWKQSGWQSCVGLRGKAYSTEQISSAIEFLKPIFTAGWFRDMIKTPIKNVLLANLIHIGPPSNDFRTFGVRLRKLGYCLQPGSMLGFIPRLSFNLTFNLLFSSPRTPLYRESALTVRKTFP